MRWAFIVAVICMLFTIAGQANAQSDAANEAQSKATGDAVPQGDSASVLPGTPNADHSPSPSSNHIEFGAGVFGFANGNFMDKPSGADFDLAVPYPGFAGAGGGGGLAMNALWRGIIGIEVQIMHSTESAEGNIDVQGRGSVDAKIEQTSLHVPLLLKIQAPTETVRPYIIVGPDFVSPSDTEMSSLASNFGASSNAYTALAFGFGMEFRLGIEGHDFRIPLMLRGNYNSGAGSKVSDRVETNVGAITYSGEWQWQAFATLGLSYYFEAQL